VSVGTHSWDDWRGHRRCGQPKVGTESVGDRVLIDDACVDYRWSRPRRSFVRPSRQGMTGLSVEVTTECFMRVLCLFLRQRKV
jgi:hypothetical protein